MHSKSDNIEIMIYDKVQEVIEELFEILLNKYQIGLETAMRGSDFIFDSAEILRCKCHKIDLKRRRSYIYIIPMREKIKISFVNDDDNCFQCVATVELNNK